jgi:hypothetical protein
MAGTGSRVQTKPRSQGPFTGVVRLFAGALFALLRALWPSRRAWRMAFRGLQRMPVVLRVLVLCVICGTAWLAGNWLYQVARKPAELFFPFDGSFAKRPEQLWRSYAPAFREHSTARIDAHFLAALAQAESAGNPTARTYWRWQWSWNPLRWYAPASSAVGMYQITDSTFVEMKRYCIHRHKVAVAGPWYDARSCWFNSLYFRALPDDAIEMTSAYLDHQVRDALRRAGRIGGKRPSLVQQRNLAAVIHLCGAGSGRAYALRDLRPLPQQHCGSHELGHYLRRLDALHTSFRAIDAAQSR